MIRNLESIQKELPSEVRLVAVTKQVSVEAMRSAYEAGIRDFGENRLQEALSKQEQLQDLKDIRWHFIGHLQSNKAKKALEHFQWIQSCDSLKLAQRLNRLAGELSCFPNVCLQVKMLPDPSKYGWTVEQLWQDLPKLDACEHLKIKGLMTILPLGLSPSETLSAFKSMQDLATEINQSSEFNLQIQELSMGMSADYPLAIQAGATMVRLGRVLFGERNT